MRLRIEAIALAIVIYTIATPNSIHADDVIPAKPSNHSLPQRSENLSSPKPDTAGQIHLEMNNVDVRQVAAYFSSVTGFHIEVVDDVTGALTIAADDDVTLDEALHVFQVRLSWSNYLVHDFSLMENKNVKDRRYVLNTSFSEPCLHCNHPLDAEIEAKLYHQGSEGFGKTIQAAVGHDCGHFDRIVPGKPPASPDVLTSPLDPFHSLEFRGTIVIAPRRFVMCLDNMISKTGSTGSTPKADAGDNR